MRLGIKGKQVLGVTMIVGAVVVVLSVIGLARLAEVSLDESHARAELLGNAIIHRAHEVDVGTGDPFQALRADPGLRSILEASLYGNDVTFAAIVDSNGVSAMSADPSQEQQPIHAAADLDELLSRSSFSKLTAIYRDQGRNLDYSTPLLLGDQPIGSVRIGVSTLLIRRDLNRSLGPAAITALGALGIAVFGATILAQLLLRPIHVIRSGLTRLGKGEKDVQLDLGGADEFGELGTFFNTVSAQIAADRSQMAGHVANLESAVQQLEDAVAIVGPDGRLLFANPALRALAPAAGVGALLSQLVPPQHPLRLIAEDALNTRQSRGPTAATFASASGEESERLLIANPVNDAKGGLVGVMVVARNLEYLSEVQSTLRYSRKLAALGRLSQGVAHEVKNPLNAMMIHLELLRQYVAPSALASARGTGGGPLGIAAVDAGPRRRLSNTSTSSRARFGASTTWCRDS
ncbi:MAG: PAS domain-containing protein [Vicinamibacterales bacterium]